MIIHDSPLVRAVIGSAIDVHSVLGPGLLESVYERCLTHELSTRGIAFRRQVDVPVRYKDLDLEFHYRVDILVEEKLLVEVKTVRTVAPVHVAQVLTYLRLLRQEHGLLINFNVAQLKEGIRSVVLKGR
jgi:GxxExxY protein